MKNYHWFLGLLFLFPSCEGFWLKEDEIDLNLDHLPVIHSFISPDDSLIRVSLKYAEPTVGFVPDDMENTDPVMNAQVVIFDEVREVVLNYTEDTHIYNADYYAYEDNLSISTGTSYKLKVLTAQGETAQCECTVPEGNINQITLKRINDTEDGNLYAFEFRDLPGERNYYAVALAQYSWYDEKNFERYFTLQVFSDELADGMLMNSKYYSMEGYNPRALLLEVDEHYYNYHTSLNEYYQIRDNPFAEPYNIYSNVEGGFGIFACYKILAEIEL
ncbi:MAG: DUF4249 domain-containing protein [Candidatus Cyclobacteriaceae bacterium M2_1C_046]